MNTLVVTNLKDLNNLAKVILSERSNVILLKGDLGAGKTTLTQYIGEELGVKTRVNSPTFTILKQHKITTRGKYKKLLHYDLYRLSNIDEVEELGFFEELEEASNFIVVEWPELLIERLSKYLLVEINLEKDVRKVSITKKP